LNSDEFLRTLRSVIFKNKKLYTDVGLNGGGWHIHKKGGKLNTHLDYSLHPKLGLQRKLNIIIYLNSNWKKEWEGNLGLWSNESDKKPGDLVKKIEPKFNRAILFDTTQNSWHGLPDALKCPNTEFRKSIAVYYLCEPPKKVNKRGKALFAPTNEQASNKAVIDLIKKRSDTKTASSTYK
jgi:Rps23 Pro-64 3,4-dihydroxylase Tpa1-like proline 4-hydroxylase